MAAAKKTFEFFLKRLLKGFRSVEKREPNNLEMILIRQEAGNKAKDAAKVIEVDFGKPFSKEIEAMIKSGDVKVGKAPKTPPYEKSQADIEFEIMEKINSDNAKAVRAFESRNPKNKMSDTEKQFNKDVEESGGMEAFLDANPISGTSTKRYFKGVEIKDPTFDETLPFDNDAEKLAEIKMSNEAYDMEKARGTEPKNKLKFRLNKERFKKDFNVTDEEVEKISLLSPEDQQKKVREYIDKDFKERIELSDYDVTDLEPNAEGGRAGYYTGGMIDVEPNLSDIGHGSDSLMARTRLVSPNSQATTSTGLNYLLAEDNDNIRVPFGNGYGVKDHQAYLKQMDADLLKHFKRYKKIYGGKMNMKQFAPKFIKEYAEGGRAGFSGGGMGRRAFLKLLATLGGATAAAKSGILGLGEGVGKKAVTETIKKSAGSSTPPPYFFELMETISKNGREIKSYGERVRQTIAPSKDGKSELLLTEDLNTGSVQIKKIYKEDNNMVTKSEEMTYTKNMGDETTQGKPADDYEEITEFNSRIYKDQFNDPDVVEGIDVESIIKEVDVKKASGGIAQMIGE